MTLICRSVFEDSEIDSRSDEEQYYDFHFVDPVCGCRQALNVDNVKKDNNGFLGLICECGELYDA
jgi:hypothetical protein